MHAMQMLFLCLFKRVNNHKILHDYEQFYHLYSLYLLNDHFYSSTILIMSIKYANFSQVQ